ncbi:MAG: peroxiredoxin [Hellea sp.]|nr:peroxiredoxin [Hellea sp.]MDG1667226.1 peroxiredoxin [Hellea sp.]|tara:strand:+ start:623 stop:1105 length:483 start_codon:yes stop_codon:yes gene_type:complete
MSIQKGDKIPSTNFMTMGPDGPEPIDSETLFNGKRVALFAVPGAFTPTCSAKHLPGYKNLVSEFKEKGIDTIACTSVNDVFVMDAWGKDQGLQGEIILLADGNGSFAKAVGLELDGSGFGMGSRSQRYAMVINDTIVENVFVENGGEFKVSAADYLLENL